MNIKFLTTTKPKSYVGKRDLVASTTKANWSISSAVIKNQETNTRPHPVGQTDRAGFWSCLPECRSAYSKLMSPGLQCAGKTTLPRNGRVRLVLSRFGSRYIWQMSSRNSLSRH